HRVLQALWVLSGTSEKDQKLRNSLISNLKQLNNIDDATIKKNAGIVFSSIIHRYSDFSISTIDSFAHRLVRTFTRDLNLPSQFEIELSSENLANRVVDILLSKVGNDAFITETILSFVMHKMELETTWQVDRDLKNFTQKLFREEAFLYSRNNAIIDEADIKFAKELILNEINRHETYIKQIASAILDILASQQIQPYDLIKGKAGIGNVIIRLSKGEMKEVFTQKTLINYFDPETPYIKKSDTVQLHTAFTAIESQIIEQMHLLKNFYESEFQRFILLTLLKKHIHTFALQSQILEIVKEISNENLIVHISEFNKSIAQLLQNAVVPYIYERLGERFSHFLLDEFQDTSILQWQNFLPLIENSLANGNINLIVGDGKQSIYRFRSGEVEQFLCLPEIYKKESSEALHRIEGLLKKHYDFRNLNTNYRSAPEIVEFNGGFFDFLRERLADSMRPVFDE
ncbi:MAG: UvrD-helicase domain-containing protein, partial [Ignavibacteria bacterium]|nr:UvrD-helicase domain-containing protein [Ignavibacteria bacterium]